MNKIGIGVPVYNNYSTVRNLLYSILALTDFTDIECEFSIINDGSNKVFVNERLAELCSLVGAKLLTNEENKGVPYSWNRLTRETDCDLMFILNDDTYVTNKYWLKCAIWCIENNPNVGIVSFPERRITKHGEDQGVNYPGLKHPIIHAWPSGSFFGFRKDLWSSIRNPDGSVGFWEDLFLFGEDWDFGLSCLHKGFYTCVIPFPLYEHEKSQTVSINKQCLIRKNVSDYLPDDEYYRVLSKSRSIKTSLFRKLKNRKVPIESNLYSRMMLAKKWQEASILDDPAIVAERAVETFNEGALKWLDEKLSPHEISCDEILYIKALYN